MKKPPCAKGASENAVVNEEIFADARVNLISFSRNEGKYKDKEKWDSCRDC
jgi:hypothetical protein